MLWAVHFSRLVRGKASGHSPNYLFTILKMATALLMGLTLEMKPQFTHFLKVPVALLGDFDFG